MTQQGGREHHGAVVQVTGMGSGSGDGWQEVTRLSGAKFVHDRVAFMVFGKFGWAGDLSGTPNFSVMQLALGDSTGRIDSTNYLTQVEIKAAHMREVWYGLPFFFLVVLDGPSGLPSQWFGQDTWNLSHDLVLYARTFRNGDGAGYSGTFKVADVSFLWFDLQTIPSTDWFSEESIRNGETNAIASEAKKNWFATSGVPGRVGEWWLHFFAMDYRPQDQASAPHWEYGYLTDGTFPSFVRLVGSHRNGMYARGTIFNSARYQHGGFGPAVQSTAVGFAPAVIGRDTHSNSALRTRVQKIRVFSVRIERMFGFRVWGVPEYPRVTTSWGNFAIFQPFEVIVPASSEYTVLAQHFVRPEFSALRAFTPWVHTDTTLRELRRANLHCLQEGMTEAPPCHTLVTEAISGEPGKRAESRYMFNVWSPPGRGHAELWSVHDAYNVGWFFDDDPSNFPDGLPSQPLPVLLNPGGESIAIGSLPELPVNPSDSPRRLVPDARYEEQQEAPIEVFRSDTGYERTWPRFVKVRSEWSFPWIGLNRQQRDALINFWRANAVWKWTIPGDSAPSAFALAERPAWQDTGRQYSLQLRVVQLVNTGP